MRIQRAHVDVVGAIRTAIVVVVIIEAAYRLGAMSFGLALGIGALFASIGDTADSFPRRLRAMAWSTLWSAVGTLFGGLVSDYGLIHVLVAFAFAAACGFAGGLGPRGGLIGTLSLVLFAVFSGSSIGTGISFLDAGLVLAGGAAYILITLAPWPFHRLGTARTSVARAYREFAQATTRTGIEIATPAVATEIMAARTVLDHAGVQGATADWLGGLLSDLERSRLALVALVTTPEEHAEYAERARRAAGVAALRIGDSLVGPLRPDVAAALADLESVVAEAPNEALAILVHDLADPLVDAASRVRRPWPTGRRAEIRRPPIVPVSVSARLKAHLHRTDIVFEHAVRLSLAFGTATIIAVAGGWSHAYWFPMTVAWVAKPDLSGTVTRVFMRIAGTLVGVVVVAVFVLLARATPVEGDFLALGVGLATYLAIAYIWANYPVAVVGITMFVLFFEHLDGAGLRFDLIARVAFTLLAGVWVLAFSLTRPRRGGSAALDAMERTVQGIRGYASAVRDRGDIAAARATLTRERTAAVAAVTAAATEPRGLFERSDRQVDPGDAAILLTDALDAASLVVTEELLGEHGRSDPALWGRIDAELDGMQKRITALRA
ncbi:MAG: FUSC family protein [Candidatus Nanopelagicales bacterium]